MLRYVDKTGPHSVSGEIMQLSYGEESLQVGDFTCGKVRVLGIYADTAIYPRLILRLGWALHEIPAVQSKPYSTAGLSGYRLVDLVGELRLGENNGRLVGPLWPSERPVDVRSSPVPSEMSVTIACDLDHTRLQTIEAHRGGQSATFSLTLWPTLLREGQRLESRIRPVRFQLPRETWMEFLTSVQFGEYEVIELKRSLLHVEQFTDVVEQLKRARIRIDHGEYNSAVSTVRTAVEKTVQQVRGSGPSLKEILAGPTDTARGEAYAAIVTHLKNVCSRAVHKPEATVTYSRAEALFILRVAEASMSLLGMLVPPDTDS